MKQAKKLKKEKTSFACATNIIHYNDASLIILMLEKVISKQDKRHIRRMILCNHCNSNRTIPWHLSCWNKWKHTQQHKELEIGLRILWWCSIHKPLDAYKFPYKKLKKQKRGALQLPTCDLYKIACCYFFGRGIQSANEVWNKLMSHYYLSVRFDDWRVRERERKNKRIITTKRCYSVEYYCLKHWKLRKKIMFNNFHSSSGIIEQYWIW